MVTAVNTLGVDGIDLAQKQGYGTINMNANDESSIQLYMASLLRSRLPNHLISYTFPGYEVDFPFRDVLQYGHQYFDTITLFRANDNAVDIFVNSLGVPMAKVCFYFNSNT